MHPGGSHGGHGPPEHHTTAHKNFDPLPWESYFDELFYLGDVRMKLHREHQFSGLEMLVPCSSASMERAILRSPSQL